MKVRVLSIDTDNKTASLVTNINDIRVYEKSYMTIDCATNTGIAIFNTKDKKLLYSIKLGIDDGNNETPVAYKVAFKRLVLYLLKLNPFIVNSVYEEPYAGYVAAAKILYSLRTSVEELIAENVPNLDYLHHLECANTKWKTLFLDKVPKRTDDQKNAITAKVFELYPFLKEYDTSQDERDAIGLGVVVGKKLENASEQSLKSKQKATKFNYEIRFISANNDDDMWNELGESVDKFKIPIRLFNEFIEDPELINLTGKGRLDVHIFDNMGQDDRLLLFSFPVDRYADMLLKHRMSHMALMGCSRMYAVVWRTNRKKKK